MSALKGTAKVRNHIEIVRTLIEEGTEMNTEMILTELTDALETLTERVEYLESEQEDITFRRDHKCSVGCGFCGLEEK